MNSDGMGIRIEPDVRAQDTEHAMLRCHIRNKEALGLTPRVFGFQISCNSGGLDAGM